MKYFALLAISLSIFFIPPQGGLSDNAYQVLAIFVLTLLSVMTKVFPTGAIAFFSISLLSITNTLPLETILIGFTNPVVWLIVTAFIISRGFIKSQLGERIALLTVAKMGSSFSGLTYAIIGIETLLAPLIPSNTARSGGIIYPILQSLTASLSTTDKQKNELGAFLMQLGLQASVITSSLFLTSMAGNPIVQHLALQFGVEISWALWFKAASLPAFISLIILPFILRKLIVVSIDDTKSAQEMAIAKKNLLGKLSRKEWYMLGTFIFLILGWSFGDILEIKALTIAFCGLSFLIATNVLSWNDIIKEHKAWDALIWFSLLITLAESLKNVGITQQIAFAISNYALLFNWYISFPIAALLYFTMHYFVASSVAHIGALYIPFLAASIAVGTPPVLASLVLGFVSSLFMGLTHYSSGPAALFYEAGYLSTSTFWKIGGVVGFSFFCVWLIVGSVWWKYLSLY